MRVLFVTNQFPTMDTPGASPCIKQQKKAIEQLGHKVDVLFIKNRLGYLKAAWQVFRLIQVQGRYDLVHAHYGAFCALASRMQFRRPLVVTFRGSDIMWKRERFISRLVGKSSDAAIVMTKEMKRMLGRDDAHVIPYGVDLDIFRPLPQTEARQLLGLQSASPLVLFPYDPRRALKRFDLVEQAVPLLREEFPDVQVLTIFNKPHDIVATYMNACDALVLTSDREGSPVAIREALACNLAIVSVAVGDVQDVMQGIEGCYLVRQNVEDIAEKLARVLRIRRRTQGRLAVQNMSISQLTVKVVAIFDDLVDKDSERHFIDPACKVANRL